MKQQQQVPQRPLEEVLRDPSAGWGEIRSAIRGQGATSACTNVAIMQALANERTWAAAAVATAIVLKERQEQVLVDQNDEDNDMQSIENCGDEAASENEVVISDLPSTTSDFPKESHHLTEVDIDNITTSTRSRGHRGGPGSSFGRSGRRRSTRRNSGSFLIMSSFKASSASINIMDFGVNECILDLSDSNRTGDNNLRGSEFSDDISNSGFMGWKHKDDRSVKSSFTLDKSIQLDGSDKDSVILSDGDLDDLKESLSNLVDSSGFLDWRHSVRRRSSCINTVDEDEDELSCNNRATWNIEDYDGTDNYKRSSSDYMSVLTHRLKRFGPVHRTGVDRKDDITIDDIKQALLNIRSDESGDRKQNKPEFRRPPAICGVPPGEALAGAVTKTNHVVTQKTNRTRRQTIIGNAPFLGAMLNVGKSNNGENLEDNHLDSPTNANESKKNAPTRRRSIMDGVSPFVGKKKDQVEKAADTPSHDDREAIWISRKDGNVDIEKECRKLYSEVNSQEKRGSGLLQRT
jgi:hypothetical protein